MAASVRVIFSTGAAWAVTNDADVAENVLTASMRTKKSRVDIEIYWGGGVVVLVPTTSAGAVVLGDEDSRGTEDAETVGNGVVEAGAGIKDAGA